MGPSPTRGAVCCATCLPGLPAPWELSCLRASSSLCSCFWAQGSHSPRALPKWGVSEKWSRDHRIAPGAVVPKASRWEETVNWPNLGTRHSSGNPHQPYSFDWMAKCVNLIFLTKGQHRSICPLQLRTWEAVRLYFFFILRGELFCDLLHRMCSVISAVTVLITVTILLTGKSVYYQSLQPGRHSLPCPDNRQQCFPWEPG